MSLSHKRSSSLGSAWGLHSLCNIASLASGLSPTVARRTLGPFGEFVGPNPLPLFPLPEPDPKSKHIIHGRSKAGREAGSVHTLQPDKDASNHAGWRDYNKRLPPPLK